MAEALQREDHLAVDDREELKREIAAWERQRNLAGAHLKCMFTTEKVRIKMGRAYPRPAAALDQPAKKLYSLCRRTRACLQPAALEESRLPRGARIETP